MEKICTDLAKEYEELDAIVGVLDESGWNVMTPAEGWTVKDQIRHLAYYDERARQAVAAPEAFEQHLADIANNPDGHRETLEKVGEYVYLVKLSQEAVFERTAQLNGYRRDDKRFSIGGKGICRQGKAHKGARKTCCSFRKQKAIR